MNIGEFKICPVLGILRGIKSGSITPLIETVASTGLRAIEITMNTKGAASLIKQAVKASGKRLAIGAGTVLTERDLGTAIDAGATFIVMPVLIEDLVKACVKKKIPVFPGALTPQEIYRAWQSGATMVKVFPSGVFGPNYFAEVKGPFNDIELLACGGVTPENMKEYFKCGASAVAFGASVFRKEWLDRGDFKSIGEAVRRFIDELSHCERTPKG